MLGSIELGGTKIICAISDGENLVKKSRFDTNEPDENIKEIAGFFKDSKVSKIGVGMFGPIDVNKNSKTYGYVLNTPKLKWQNYNFLSKLKENIDAKIFFTTDVNEAAMGEYELGAGKDKNSLLYLTIGTGIGGGMIYNGKILEGITHPEMGHIELERQKEDDVESVCSFHKNSLEGLASGPSIEKRTNTKGENLDKDHEVFELVSKYIAKALVTYTLILRPEIIVIGGGVINTPGMIDKIRKNFKLFKSDYIDEDNIEEYIVMPKLKNDSGIMGGFELAKKLED